MMIFYKEITGWPIGIETRLRKKVGALWRHGAYHQKIGITNNPERRWRERHSRDRWSRMHVIYKSTSHRHTCEIEKRLIEWFDFTPTGGYHYNACSGGGGRIPTGGPYYVYVLTAARHTRLYYLNRAA
jgi:hypothetical protein